VGTNQDKKTNVPAISAVEDREIWTRFAAAALSRVEKGDELRERDLIASDAALCTDLLLAEYIRRHPGRTRTT
jgi:hypothetical protein